VARPNRANKPFANWFQNINGAFRDFLLRPFVAFLARQECFTAGNFLPPQFRNGVNQFADSVCAFGLHDVSRDRVHDVAGVVESTDC